MVIQELKPSQRVQGRWLAMLEDGSILRVGQQEIADFALYAGRELTEEEAAALTAGLRSRQMRERALELLSRKPQSRRELTRKLNEWGAGPEEADAVCDRMEELGYLNEAAYAARIVEVYSARGFGEKKLRDELYRRGVPREEWDEALARVEDSTQAIDDFLQKKLTGWTGDRKQLQKVTAALARRGFSWSDIRDALARYETGIDIEYD
ncbi:recombination regulator RecX [Colidextribacter sp. 210702-DFI.3.9]|nr:recombination regulator RecX [Colidextribacter sp. 210702-DFI.3.9]MCG4469025.1 recombination regulator RecX [Lawsonibacter sp. DFI.6.74]MCG4774518.1 recombination regulator RecX [Lawsonibacter sp. DFI.5.51]